MELMFIKRGQVGMTKHHGGGTLEDSHPVECGGFHQWGYPHSWMVYHGKSHFFKWMTGGSPILGHPPMGFYNWLVVLNIFLFSIIYGMPSFPLTFIFSEGFKPPTSFYHHGL